MVKAIMKWLRKRPRDPWIPSTSAHSNTKGSQRFRRRSAALAQTRVIPGPEPEPASAMKSTTVRKSENNSDKLEILSSVTKVLNAICDAPVLNVVKPLVAIADFACQKAQAVNSYREAIDALEDLANEVGELIAQIACQQRLLNSIGVRTQINGIICILEQARVQLEGDRLYSDPRRRWKLWFITTSRRERTVILSNRLRDARLNLIAASVLGLVETLSNEGVKTSQKADTTEQEEIANRITLNGISTYQQIADSDRKLRISIIIFVYFHYSVEDIADKTDFGEFACPRITMFWKLEILQCIQD
ncbi:hypothetical protein R3P38DRAFT_920156 [Favolaschia claudopus]|uniref:Fungal N-terminal domain-containing protein n=1 Tax=Favolaschia claudopus TaxID=2862362 RepID=A0AAW0BNS0_9AGAR